MTACRAVVPAAIVLMLAWASPAGPGHAGATSEGAKGPATQGVDGGSPAGTSGANDVAFDTVEALLRTVPKDRMPPGNADGQAVRAFRRWAKETLAGRRLIAEIVVDRVSASLDGTAVLRGHVAVPIGLHGRTARCKVQADFRYGAAAALAQAPGRSVTLVGKLASSDPLYPSRGTVRTAGGEVRVAGWSERYAFLAVHLVECSTDAAPRPPKPGPGPAPAREPPPSEPPPAKAPANGPGPALAVPHVKPDLDPAAAPNAEVTEPGEEKVGFFGVRDTRATRIVYVVDRSGSMTDSIDYVKFELKRSVAALKDDVMFHICFYSSGPPVEMPTRTLVRATDAAKQRAFDFIDGIIPQGQTDPTVALERAFEEKPDLIYLLTDGEFDRRVADRVRELNRERKVRVHTVGFIYNTGERVLKEIAARNGGLYKFVTEKDLARMGQEEGSREAP